MKRVLLLLAAVLLCSRFASADGALPCEPGSIWDYEVLGETGCVIDDKVFHDFYLYYFSSGGDWSLNLDPLAVPLNPGFQFQVNLGPEADYGSFLFSYTVDVLPGGNLIKDNSLSLDLLDNVWNSVVWEEPDFYPYPDSPDVFKIVWGGEDYKPGGFYEDWGEKLFDSATFPPQAGGFVWTYGYVYADDFELSTQLAFSEQFSEVPEPASLFLLGSGLAGIAGFRRKRLSRKG